MAKKLSKVKRKNLIELFEYAARIEARKQEAQLQFRDYLRWHRRST